MTSDPEPFDDVNEAVGEEWEAETTPYERIREVISHTYTPVSAAIVADRARTSPKTARKHLQALADEGFVATTAGDHGGTHYHRSSHSLVVEQAAKILATVSTDELVTRIAAMRETIRAYQEEYGVESPEELIVVQANQTVSGADGDSESIDTETLREWQTTRRKLAFATAALAVGNAERFVDDERTTVDRGRSAQ